MHMSMEKYDTSTGNYLPEFRVFRRDELEEVYTWQVELNQTKTCDFDPVSEEEIVGQVLAVGREWAAVDLA